MNKLPMFLLADDDPDDHLLFTEALQEIHAGIHVIIAKNGREALQVLQNDLFELPDYIFLDLNMPVMNGLECLEAIKKVTHLDKVRVVIYSTHISPAVQQQIQKMDARAFRKPDNYQALVQYLRQLMM